MKRIWVTISSVLGLVAIVFAFRSDFDKAFVLAAVGVVSWFLGYRAEIKEKMDAAENQEPKELDRIDYED